MVESWHGDKTEFGSRAEALLSNRQASIEKTSGQVAKASSADIVALKDSLNKTWSDVDTLAKVASHKKSLDALASNRALQIDQSSAAAIAKGELSFDDLINAALSAGSQALSWVYLNDHAGKADKGSDSSGKKGSGDSSLPDAVLDASSILFVGADKGKPARDVVYRDDAAGVTVKKHGSEISATVKVGETGSKGEIKVDPEKGTGSYEEGGKLFNWSPRNFHAPGLDIHNNRTLTIRNDGGQTLSELSRDQQVEYRQGLIIFNDRQADTLESAFEAFKKSRVAEKAKPQDLVVLNYKNGAALFDLANNRLIEFVKSAAGMELYYDLGDGKKLRRDAHGVMYIISEAGTKVLDQAQKQELIKQLGEKAKLVARIIAMLENHQADTTLDSGQTFGLDQTTGIIKLMVPGKSQSSSNPAEALCAEIDRRGYKIWQRGKSTTFDNATGVHSSDEGVTASTAKLDTPDLDVETPDFQRRDGDTAFKHTNVTVKRNGDVVLPGGTMISHTGDVHFGDGSMLTKDGRFIGPDSGLGVNGTGIPRKEVVDSVVANAISLAQSVSARAGHGPVRFSDVQLIQANLAIIANFINVFSLSGHLAAANRLASPWSTLCSSLDQAQFRLDRQEEGKLVRSYEIGHLLHKLERVVS